MKWSPQQVIHLPMCGIFCLPWNWYSGDEGESTSGYTFTPVWDRLLALVYTLRGRRGVHSRLYIYPCVGSFACPGIDTQVKKGSPQQVIHSPLCGIVCLPWYRHSGEEGESTSGYTFTPAWDRLLALVLTLRWRRGVHSRLYIYPCVGPFACPGIDTQGKKGSTQQVIQSTPVWDRLLALV
jgi:hypothetical protein